MFDTFSLVVITVSIARIYEAFTTCGHCCMYSDIYVYDIVYDIVYIYM